MKHAVLSELTLDQLIHVCQKSIEAKQAGPPDYTFELFRRAFQTQNEDAWRAIVTLFGALVCKWVHKTAPGAYDVDEANDVAMDVFAKMWRTLSPHAESLPTRFPNTAALMGYLNRSTVSVVLDERRREQRRVLRQVELSEAVIQPKRSQYEKKIEESVAQNERMAQLQRWIAENVTDSAEKMLLKLTYEYGLPPRELVAQCPEYFPDTRTVKRLRERLLKRARRNLLD